MVRSPLLLPVSLSLSHFASAEFLLWVPCILKLLSLFEKIFFCLLKECCRNTYRPKRLFRNHHTVLREVCNFSKASSPESVSPFTFQYPLFRSRSYSSCVPIFFIFLPLPSLLLSTAENKSSLNVAEIYNSLKCRFGKLPTKELLYTKTAITWKVIAGPSIF